MRLWIVLAGLLAAAGTAAGEPRSGYDDAGPATRAIQDDDAANPGFLWVQEGESLWGQPAGAAGKSCAGCHGAAPTTMRGVAARYPAYDPRAKRVFTLEQRINQCRTGHQQAPPLASESEGLLALTAYVGVQSRGLPVQVVVDGAARRFLNAGRALFSLRQGQLNLSCANCHDDLAGERLGGSVVPQGHPNGYPTYRLEWQGLGSLMRRLRNCLNGIRAEPLPPDGPDMTNLAFFLAWRANGLRVETPAVRP